MKQISSWRPVLILLAVHAIAAIPSFSQGASTTYNITQSGSANPGYFLISPTNSDTLGVVDNYGRMVFPNQVGMQNNLSSYKNRELTYFGRTKTAGSQRNPCHFRLNAEQQVTDTVFPIGPYQTDFHEGFATSDSTFMILGSYNVVTDLSNFVAGGKPDAEVIGAVIQEVTRSGRVLFEWKSLDHIPYSDATEDIDFTQSIVDVIHINSICRDNDGGLLISCRHLDEVIKIDGKTGQIIWRLGGSKSKHNQFRYLNDTISGFFGFSHQHCVFRTSRGTMLMFDNGNLKPEPRSSRVVEYEIDEKEKTARKVFEYRPKPEVFASSMGSVTNFPNGNILIGFGSAFKQTGEPSEVAAEEIDRNGNVVATVFNTRLPRLFPYRILKTSYGMTGVQHTITTAGSKLFSDSDSTTLITLQTAMARKPVIVTVERHHYPPRNVTYSAPTLYCAPARWGVRLDDTTALTGTTKLRLSGVEEVEDPGKVNVLYRPIEGSGSFTILTATYSSADSSWTIPFIKQGEYAVAYNSRLRPELIAPLNESLDVDERPQFRWNKLLFASSYQLQFARDSAFTSGVESVTVTDTVFTPSALRNKSVFWWRMRKISGQGAGPWSAHWHFTTKFNRPVILEPTTDTQSVFVNAASLFRWTSIKGATGYRIVVSDSGAGAVLDSVLTDTVCRVVGFLPTDAQLSWNVCAIIDSVTGPPSKTCIITTAPQQPIPIAPEPNVYLPNTSKTVVSWRTGENTIRHKLSVVTVPESKVIVDTVLDNKSSFTVEELQSGKRYRWTCSALGTFGPSLPSVREFVVAERSTFPRPVISGPLQRSGVSWINRVECAWLSVPGASEYHMQVAQDVVFDNPIIDTIIDRESIGVDFDRASSLYAWRVQARNGFDISPWSDTVYTSTVVDSSLAIVPIYPMHGTNAAKTDDVFRYQASPEFFSFQVDLARDPRFLSIDFKLYSFTDSASYAFLPEGERYYWRVIGTTLSGQTYLSQVSTMVVNTSSDVAGDDLSYRSIWSERIGEEIILHTRGLGAIESVGVYTLLGQCIRTEGPFDNGAELRILLQDRGPLFLIVTNSAGNTYYVGAW